MKILIEQAIRMDLIDMIRKYCVYTCELTCVCLCVLYMLNREVNICVVILNAFAVICYYFFLRLSSVVLTVLIACKGFLELYY
jgi:hypothetical protein